MNRTSQSGMTVYELLVVAAVLLAVIAMVMPIMATAINIWRLRGGAADYANLLQSARMRAVQDDRYHPVTNIIGNAAGGYNAYVDFFGNASYSSGDAAVVLPAAVRIQNYTAAPSSDNLRSQYLPSTCGANGACVTIDPNYSATPPYVVFGPRGLPCQATALSGGTCSYISASGTAGINGSSGNLPIAFEVYFQNTQAGLWEAVTVNPAGRIREWSYDAHTTTWSPLN